MEYMPCVSVILYAIFASYFAGVMVRLMLTLTPIVCVLAAIAFSKAFEIYLKDDSPKAATKAAQEPQEKQDSKYYDKVTVRTTILLFLSVVYNCRYWSFLFVSLLYLTFLHLDCYN